MKYLIAAALVVGTCAVVYAHDHHDEQHGDDHHTHPKYEFEYGVKDTKTGDIKDQWEHRDGDHVKGAYSLKESDGTTRVVKYHANDHSGFHAEVKKIGHAHHPETPHHGHDDHQHGHNDHHHGHDDHHHGHDDHHHEAHHDHHDGHHEVHHDDHHDAHHHHDDHHDDAHHHGHDHGHGHATSYANIHQHH